MIWDRGCERTNEKNSEDYEVRIKEEKARWKLKRKVGTTGRK